MSQDIEKKDLVKYFGIALTCMAILLWSSGYGFKQGYWTEAGLSQAFINYTVQETILTGMFALKNWYGLIIFLLSLGVYLLVTASLGALFKMWRKKKGLPANNWKKVESEPLNDHGVFRVGGYLVMGSMIVFITLFAAAFWHLMAEKQGRAEYRRIVCINAKPSNWSETIHLANGTDLSGASISIADGFSLLMTDKSLLVVDLKNGPRVVETVKLPQVDCPA